MANKEVWRGVKGYEGLYEVSNMGNIKSLDKIHSRNVVGLESYLVKGKMLKPRPTKQGYLLVALFKDGKRDDVAVHRVVGDAFVQGKTDINKTINHKNGIKWDNRAENLEWCSQMANNRHAKENGYLVALKGEDNPCSKLRDRDVRRIKMAMRCGMSQRSLAYIYKVGKSTIGQISTGRNWKHIKLNIM